MWQMRRRRRWHSQKSKPRNKRRTILLIIMLIMLICTLQLFSYIERNMVPPTMHLAKVRVQQIATEAINKAITTQVTEGQRFDKLIEWKTEESGKVSGFMLNYAEHMKITSDTIQVVQSTLQNIHMLKENIPLGMALGSPVLASFGPKIPVRIEPQGAVKVELSTRQQDAGINMILVEVYIHITTEVSVVIPFDIEAEKVETEIPISYLLVVGDVPMYYYDNKGNPIGENGNNAPNISVPMNTPPSEGQSQNKSGEGAASEEQPTASDVHPVEGGEAK
ncbi:sporulation protein YunB [Paenibacillus sediminis]|uniref:Sporulation protein YunB n=1 Tax=Paenibacillus sediminis TaxID=664909 RepID=A0ABS4H5Z9_9BACL|nr:sporulation protein YunB [Paenibacillus sediminis]MBP1937969.1 sporulation protein YunB [Paenibacillus sediminis]